MGKKEGGINWGEAVRIDSRIDLGDLKFRAASIKEGTAANTRETF